MGVREIPALSVLCLRMIGNPKCRPDETFKPTKDGKPSSASRLLRSFHERPVLGSGEAVNDYLKREQEALDRESANADTDKSSTSGKVMVPTLERIPMKRTPAIGIGSGRRFQANDIDLNHPWIATFLPPTRGEGDDSDEDEYGGKNYGNVDNIPTDPETQTLVAESGSCATDLLQSYVDSLVEMGRMDDTRLGLQFFAEYKTNIELQYKSTLDSSSAAAEESRDVSSTQASAPPAPAPILDTPIPKKKKRKRSGGAAFSAAKKKKEAEAKAAAEAKRQAAIVAAVPKSRGSLSLHNCMLLAQTSSNILTSRLLEHIHALDLTGLQTLTDATLHPLLISAGLQLERLSVKNCRRLTDASIHNIAEHCPNLRSVDLGGDYNIRPRTILDALAVKITKRGRGIFTSQALQHLVELHAGGIGPAGGWTDDVLPELFKSRGWKALSIGFSPYLTFAGWKSALLSVEQNFRVEEGDHPHEYAGEGGGDGTPANNNNNNNHKTNNMCQTLQSLGIAFCEQQLIGNAWLGLVGRHLPNLRALDARGNHQLHTMTSWYDGRATISNDSATRLHPNQSLVVLARYSGVSANSVEETKRVYPLAAGNLKVVAESDGIGWGILRQETTGVNSNRPPLHHYQKRLVAAELAAKRKLESKSNTKSNTKPATPEAIPMSTATLVPPEDVVPMETS